MTCIALSLPRMKGLLNSSNINSENSRRICSTCKQIFKANIIKSKVKSMSYMKHLKFKGMLINKKQNLLSYLWVRERTSAINFKIFKRSWWPMWQRMTLRVIENLINWSCKIHKKKWNLNFKICCRYQLENCFLPFRKVSNRWEK